MFISDKVSSMTKLQPNTRTSHINTKTSHKLLDI